MILNNNETHNKRQERIKKRFNIKKLYVEFYSSKNQEKDRNINMQSRGVLIKKKFSL